MQLPSVQRLLEATLLSVQRFGWVLLFAAIGTFTACAMIYTKHDNSENYILVLMTCFLGVPFLVAVRTACERQGYGWQLTQGLQLGASLLMLGYYALLPAHIDELTPVQTYQFASLWVFFHLLVAISPFLSRGAPNGFWQFNKNLFLRFLTAGLYTGVLYVGLSLALIAVDNLFNAHLKNDNIYGYLFICLTGMFNTWFFLAGVPANFDALEADNSYPKGLKIFTQFVLLPIVTIYLAILYAYLAKIIFTWHLPNGWVCYLVLGFSVAGVLALLLVHPIQFLPENKWIKTYTRWFYMALLPLIALMSLSIFIRVSAYGITENRYYMLLMAGWLLFISLYFIFAKAKNIKIIPLSLAILAIMTCWGPWGAFSVSASSQYYGLKNALIAAKILVNNKIDTAHPAVPKKLQQKIYSKINYLHQNHTLNVMQPWFDNDIRNLTVEEFTYFEEKKKQKNRSRERYDNLADFVCRYLKIQTFSRYELGEDGDPNATDAAEYDTNSSVYINAEQAKLINIKGYEEMRMIEVSFAEDETKTQEEDGISLMSNGSTKKLTLRGASIGKTPIVIDLRPYTLRNAATEFGAAAPISEAQRIEKLTLTGETTTARYKLKFRTISLRREKINTDYSIVFVSAYLFTAPK